MRRNLISLLALFLALISGSTVVLAQFDPFVPDPIGQPDSQEPRQVEMRAYLNAADMRPGSRAVIAIHATFGDGFHSNSATPSSDNYIPFRIAPRQVDGVKFFEPIYPPGKNKTYPGLGELNIYSGEVIAHVPIEVAESIAEGKFDIALETELQICDDEGRCFPPETITSVVNVQVSKDAQMSSTFPEFFKGIDDRVFARAAAAVSDTVDSSVRSVTASMTYTPVVAMLLAVLVGLIFNIMPCVLPVLPLKAMSFYKVAEENRWRTFKLGLVFSLGILAIFLGLGVLVLVLKGIGWSQLFAQGWFLAIIVVILLAMGLSMFGLFEVAVPDALHAISPRHDTYLGNFLFGNLTAILSTPCTFGLFVGLLTWALQQPAWIALTMMGCVGVGMALPYLLLSLVPELARAIPRAGRGSLVVKQFMGFLLIGSAVYFARRFLSPFTGHEGFWWLLYAVAVGSALYLLTQVFLLKHHGSRVFAGILALAIAGGGFAATQRFVHSPITFEEYSPEKLAAAEGSIVVLEFTADWCANCVFVEQTVLKDPRTVKAFKDLNVVALKADLTRSDAPGWKRLFELNPAGGIPFTAIYSPNLHEPIRFAKVYSTEDLLKALEQAK